MKPKSLRTLALLAAVLVLHSAFFKVRPLEKVPEDLLLCDRQTPEENPAFPKILKAENPEQLERAKIDYLINRIRCSEYLFIRNGSSHSAQRAAQHLTWKYHRKHDRIKNVQDFIDYLASGSSLTGQPYLIKLPTGKAYPIHEVFANEIRVLEELLAKTPALVQPEAA